MGVWRPEETWIIIGLHIFIYPKLYINRMYERGGPLVLQIIKRNGKLVKWLLGTIKPKNKETVSTNKSQITFYEYILENNAVANM